MDSREDLPLDYLLIQFGIDRERARKLVEMLQRRETQAIVELETVAQEVSMNYDYFHFLFGVQDSLIEHYAWVNIRLGDSFFRFNRLEQAHYHFYEAWRSFSHSLVGNLKTAAELVKEFPRLLQYFVVADFYRENHKTAEAYGILVPT